MKSNIGTVWGGFLLLGLAFGTFSLTDSRPLTAWGQEDGIDLTAVDALDLPDSVPTDPKEAVAPAESETRGEKTDSEPDGETADSTAPERTDASVEDSPAPSATGTSGNRFFDLVKAGGWIGAVIFLLSLGACAAAIRLFWILRRPLLLPEGLIGEFGAAIEKGRIAAAAELCRRHPSLLSSTLAGGLRNIDGGWTEVEKGMEETLAAETARLHRKADVLMVVGNIAPMLGLLGTVIGMVAAFGELAASDGLGRFANLAQGIYFALVTTVDGLLAAIPALTLYAFFSHRIAGFSADVAEVAERLMNPVRRYFHSAHSDKMAPPPTVRPIPHAMPTPPASPVSSVASPSAAAPIPPAPPTISISERRTPPVAERPRREERRFSERDDVE